LSRVNEADKDDDDVPHWSITLDSPHMVVVLLTTTTTTLVA
jgi:hypothetical protein